ncbi:MAG: hypothetical protein LBF97_04685 [Elusimicrobiota bacterium]|jgi:hypothetical protein|nr:hypothetical protein [Elusimicrobiota bacterium]
MNNLLKLQKTLNCGCCNKSNVKKDEKVEKSKVKDEKSNKTVEKEKTSKKGCGCN